MEHDLCSACGGLLALHHLYLDTYFCPQSDFFIRIHEKSCWGNRCRCSKKFVITGASHKCETKACFTPVWEKITILGHLVAMATTKTQQFWFKLFAHSLPNHNRDINHQSNVQVYASKDHKQVYLLALQSRKVAMW